jgi:hypothetical protein
MAGMTPLAADRDEIGRFYETLYRHADAGGYVSLRTFEHDDERPPVELRSVLINGEGFGPVIAEATGAANRAARFPRPAVLAPPPCTFANNRHAAEADLLNGLAIVAECDEYPYQARTKLFGILGSATIVVASGGLWIDPASGEVQPKQHLYFRLSTPTRERADHARLKQANRIAAALTGSDPTAISLVHPLRLPGSIHRKGEPKLCRIVELNEDREVDLDDALERLEQAASLALQHATGDDLPRLRLALDQRDPQQHAASSAHNAGARDDDLEALAQVIPNADEPWSEYRNVGLAFYAASDGSAAGLNAYDHWARKSSKYDGRTVADWDHFRHSPPERTGTGALVQRARRANTSFRLPSWGPERLQDTQAEQPRAVTADAAWPEPDMAVVAAHRDAAPSLPLKVFGAFWSDWIIGAAAAKSAPLDFVAAALFPIVGALIVRQRRASPWPGWSEPAVYWTANVGPPSSGKSPAIDALAGPARLLEAELNEDFAERRRQWKTDKLEADTRRALWETEAKDAVKKGHKPPLMPFDCEEPDPPNERRLVINDATPEKLIRLAAVNPYGLVHQRDELAGWLGGMDRYGGAGSERALWIEAYGARPYVLDRVKEAKPIRVEALAVGIVGGIQPDRLASLVLAGDDDGLAARLLYVWPDAQPPRRPDHSCDGDAAVAALRRLTRLDTGAEGPVVLPLTLAAADELQQWRVDVAQMEHGTAGLFMSWLGKLPGLAVRLALALEHLWWIGDRPDAPPPATISEDAVLGAVGFLEAYAVPMAKRALGDATWPEAERDAAALGKWLLAQRPAPSVVNARALRHEAALQTRDAERYDAALAELEGAGWVRPQPKRTGGKGGRQSKDWAVNPALAAAHE